MLEPETYRALLIDGLQQAQDTRLVLDVIRHWQAQVLALDRGQAAAGSAIGFVSGLVGAGGGFISVPFMTWCNVPIHNAVATSAALGFPIAVFNVVGYIVSGWQVAGRPPYSLGYVWIPAVLAVASCSVLMAPVGARTAHALPVKALKRIFACLLIVLAASMTREGLRTLGIQI